jgi:hypothetical protein
MDPIHGISSQAIAADQTGATSIEYALIAVLVGIAIISAALPRQLAEIHFHHGFQHGEHRFQLTARRPGNESNGSAFPKRDRCWPTELRESHYHEELFLRPSSRLR